MGDNDSFGDQEDLLTTKGFLAFVEEKGLLIIALLFLLIPLYGTFSPFVRIHSLCRIIGCLDLSNFFPSDRQVGESHFSKFLRPKKIGNLCGFINLATLNGDPISDISLVVGSFGFPAGCS